MLNKIVKLILDIRSQDLIADVNNLEKAFQSAIATVKVLATSEQADIIAAAQAVVAKEYQLDTDNWQTITDIEQCFVQLCKQHKRERAKDAGAKVFHAMHKVLTLQTPAEFAAFSIKYATNHNEHAKDAKDYPEFATALNIAGISAMLATTSQEVLDSIRAFEAVADPLRDDFAADPDSRDQANEIKRLQGILAALLPLDDPTNHAKLKQAFDALANLKKAVNAFDLTAAKDAAAAQLQEKQEEKAKNDAKAAAVLEIVKLIREFTELEDKAAQNQGLLAELDAALPTLKEKIAAQMNTVDDNLQDDAIAAVKVQIDALQVGTLDAKTVNGLGLVADASLDDVADAISAEKAKQRAKDAGAKILAKFNEVNAAADGYNFDAAIAEYLANHNMHALNLLEHTAENSELREIMFAAMQGLPFSQDVIRDLDALQGKFIELANAKGGV